MLLDRFLPRMDFDSYEDSKPITGLMSRSISTLALTLLTPGQNRKKIKKPSFGVMITVQKRFLPFLI